MEWLLLRCERGAVDELGPGLLAAAQSGDSQTEAILETVALSYLRQTRYPESLKVLDLWVQRAPTSARAWDWHGWVSAQLDRRIQAMDDYRRCLELDPSRNAARLRLAQVLLDRSLPVEARVHLEQLRRSQPDNSEVKVALAVCDLQQNRKTEARELLQEALATNPDHVEALFQLANLEREEQHYADSERLLKGVLTVSPHDLKARFSLHLTLLAQPGRERDAEEERLRWDKELTSKRRIDHLLRVELAVRPNDANLAAEVGELLLEQGERKLARFWLQRALVLDPGNLRAQRALAVESRMGSGQEPE
jgi:tetratricopeptide (TPR) repeat protein